MAFPWAGRWGSADQRNRIGRITDDRDHWNKRNANGQGAVGREKLACIAAGGGACARCALRRERRVRQVQGPFFGRRDRTDRAGAQAFNGRTSWQRASGLRVKRA